MRAALVGVVVAAALVVVVPTAAPAAGGCPAAWLRGWQVTKNLDRMLAGLVLVRPQG